MSAIRLLRCNNSRANAAPARADDTAITLVLDTYPTNFEDREVDIDCEAVSVRERGHLHHGFQKTGRSLGPRIKTMLFGRRIICRAHVYTAS